MNVRYSIVGQKFKGLDPYLAGTNAGVPALLVREPSNQYDPNAVAVYIDGKAVGYIPKKDNEDLAKRIDTAPDTKFRAGVLMALDCTATDAVNAIRATFVRSSNSAYPQVEII